LRKEVESEISIPALDEVLNGLKVGDVVFLTGLIHTLRDAGYERLLNMISENATLPVEFKGMAVWHCGPIARKVNGRWVVVAAGPTTSSRFTSAIAEIVKKLKVKIVVGKGPIGGEAVEALASEKGVYLATTGGAAAYYAAQIEGVESVHWMDLGMPAALWTLKVKRLGPLIVAVDSEGRDLFRDLRHKMEERIKELYKELRIDPSHGYVWWPRRKGSPI